MARGKGKGVRPKRRGRGNTALHTTVQRLRSGAPTKRRVPADPVAKDICPVQTASIRAYLVRGSAAAHTLDYGSPTKEGVITFGKLLNTFSVEMGFVLRSLCAQKLGIAVTSKSLIPASISLAVTSVKLWGSTDTNIVQAVQIDYKDTGTQGVALSARDYAGANHRARVALRPSQHMWTNVVSTLVADLGIVEATVAPEKSSLGLVEISLSYRLLGTLVSI